MHKNVASQKIELFAFIPSTGLPKTGDAAQITAYVSKDHGSVTVLGDTSAAEMDATNAKGIYVFDLTQGETNGDELTFSAKSSTSDVSIVPRFISTNPAGFTGGVAQTGDNFARLGAPVGASISADVAGVQADTDNIQTRIPTALTAGGNIKADVDTIKTNAVVNGGTVTFPTTATLASTTNITAGTVTTATNVTTVNGLAAGVITAASIASDAITDAKVASDVTIASVTGAVGSVTGAVGSVTGAVGSVTGSTGSISGVTFPTNFSSMSIDANGRVRIQTSVTKNTALAGFTFIMTDSTTHAPKTGLTVTSQRSLNGGAFAACTNSATEVANGEYSIDLSTSDMNGNSVMLRFTATAADDLFIELLTTS